MTNRNSKTIMVLALAIVIVGLGIGFAAFQNTLSISPTATVSPTNTFQLTATAPASCTITAGVSGTNPTVTIGTVSSSGQTITVSGMAVGFKNPGDKVECVYTINNPTQYIAYLKSMQYISTTLNGAASTKIVCTTPTGTALGTLGTAACEGITASATAASVTASVTSSVNTPKKTITSNNSIAKKSGSNNGTGTVTLKFEYSGSGSLSDEEIKVWIPNLQLVYKTTN